jgi:hypothetical protein
MQAQNYSAEQFVISTAGQSGTFDSISEPIKYLINWTIGEPLVETLTGSRKKLTQGFHQSLLSIKSTHVFSILDQTNFKHFSVFPNPFVSNFTIEWNFSENLNLLFEIYSLDGKRMFSKQQNASDSQLFIQLSNLKPSTYILRISDPQRNFSETHKIIKL